MADIFREIDEELRREGAINLLRRYGPIIIGVVLVVVLAVAGYTAWNYYTEQRQLDRSRAYISAVAAAGEEGGAAVEALQDLASGADGYAALAHLQAAALRAEAGETEDAIAIYRNLAADSEIEPVFRNLAAILMATHGFDVLPPEEIAGLLEPLTGPADPWRFSAKELLGLLAIRNGDTERAAGLYQELADDLEAPPNLRARATEMLAALQA